MSAAEATFVKLYDEHYDEVFAFCARRVGRSDADDATAEVFSVAWRRIDEVDATSARAWLFGVARRVVLNQWRGATRRTRLASKSRGMAARRPEQPETVLVQRAQDEEVLAVLSTMRPADQEILRLAAWEELSGPEIAVALGISLAAVQQRLHRAKKRLARRLGEEGS